MQLMRQDPQSKASRKIAFASFIGTAVDWYDFYLYGISAALIFNQLFFPKFSPVAGTMAAFGTYAVGFFARPVGGIIFGHFGDKISKTKMLFITLFLMGISTTLIGFLPVYKQIGIWAPITLLFLRILQGIAVGGEWGGGIVLAAEQSRDKERGFYSSWPNAGAPFGLVMASFFYLIFSSLPHEMFMSWGWRIPYLINIILVGLGLFIRLGVFDSPIFLEQKKSRLQSPAIHVITMSTKSFLLAMGVRFIESGSYYLLTVFVISYGVSNLGLSRYTLLYFVVLASILETFTIPMFGRLSDTVGRRPVYLFGAIFMCVFAFPFFWLLNTKNYGLISIAIILPLVIGHAAMHGTQAAFIAEQFKANVRYSGAAIAYHLSSALAGGLAPLIATWLVSTTGQSWPVSIYMILLGIITIVSLVIAKETAQKDISK